MNFSWVKPLALKGRQFLVHNASHILVGMGTAESLMAILFATQASPKAKEAWIAAKMNIVMNVHRSLDYHEAYTLVQKGDFPDCNPTFWESVKIYAKYMGPAAAMELLALLCFLGAHGIDVRRQTILAGLYSSAQECIAEYQKKVKEMIGEDAEKEINKAIAEDKVNKLPPPQNNLILAGDADTDCLIDNQYFRSSYVKIKDTQNDANWEMIRNMYISKAEVYWMLDPEKKYLKPTSEDGQVGWDLDRKLVLDVVYIMDPNHRPVLSIRYADEDGYDNPPVAGFSKMY